MKISFVIPAYNEEARIATCIRAIRDEISHTSCQVEIIVVNNASTDRTKNIALSFPGIIVVDESRKGITFARAAGVAASDGDLIASIDADTVMQRGWLKTVLQVFRNPRLVALSGPYIYYDLPFFPRIMMRIFDAVGFVFYVASFITNKGLMVCGGNLVMRRSAYMKAGGYNTSISFYGEDVDMMRRLQKIGIVKWSYRLAIHASGRRLKSEGLYTMLARYMLNYFWVMLIGRPFSTEYKDIRNNLIK